MLKKPKASQTILKTIAIAAMLISTGCASQFKTKGGIGINAGKYTTTHISENVFVVELEGEPYANKTKIEDFLFLHSAQVAKKNNYPYFKVIKKTIKTKDTAVPTQSPNAVDYNAGEMQNTYVISRPVMSFKIKGFKQVPYKIDEGDPAAIYSSSYMIEEVAEKYDLQPKKGTKDKY